ncbi:MAG: hypothetical protein ABI927_06130 [Gaiellaceae bacterium]
MEPGSTRSCTEPVTWSEIDIPDPDNLGHLLFTFPCKGSVHVD